ncbi:hypothetical protein EX30DRAFT_254623 [Ascodesmis nigricans]|uniref:Uncharacterized protein n=1 Tax=Ascodesmis nigricans TaxID=341454 RepID=A0A4S2MYB3_9PEZI|nr:hypothetical protein EX30DRAFT_254623 [Ascodesmis nigricans]
MSLFSVSFLFPVILFFLSCHHRFITSTKKKSTKKEHLRTSRQNCKLILLRCACACSRSRCSAIIVIVIRATHAKSLALCSISTPTIRAVGTPKPTLVSLNLCTHSCELYE